ncbi:membrane protein [Bordetella ansorpii]|uniref:Membrane protein n=1 Tax=Bordetella ansorpii TaxID=288768 RepID=A0A157SN43_9BORD|nr:FimV/HubP family polar landmark protein [Bordetella ansorpii]SAI71898.1 membrane protein [Bordetella ansorpii]
MTSHPRSLHHVPRNKVLGLALALAIGTSAWADAQAARAGHARVASLPGEPMRIEIPLLDLTADEAASLQVQLADAASWQRAGLQPPVPLADTRVNLEGSGAARRVVSITATQPITTQTVDMLLDLRSSAGQRQMQVTLMVPARDAEAGLRRATVPAPGAAPQPASAGAQAARRVDDVTVRPGQTLSGIAVRHAVADASIYQMLVALWQANPQAFIQNNMNLVRAGETLAIPDAATVRAVDPAEARRIFVEQAAAYDRYRARLGAAAGGRAAVPRADGSSGQVESASSGAAAAQPPAQDRLRLSNGTAGAAGGSVAGAGGAAEAAGDARASDQRAMDEARQRVDALQSNVDALNRVAAGQGASDAATGASGTQGGAAGQGNAARPAASGATAADAGSGAAAGSTGGASGGSAGVEGNASGSGASGANGPAAVGAGAAGAGVAGVGAAGAGSAGVGSAGSGAASGASAAVPGNGTAGGSSVAPGGAPSGQSGQSDQSGQSGQSGTPALAGAGGAAAGTPSATVGAAGNAPSTQQGTAVAPAKVGMPSWLVDNLLAVITAVLAVLIFIVAWMLRRAGARRNEDVEAVDYSDPPPFDSRAFSRKLDAIDLDLNHPPTDEAKPVQRDASPAVTPAVGPAAPPAPSSAPSPFATPLNPSPSVETPPAQGSGSTPPAQASGTAPSQSPAPSPFAPPSYNNRT